MPDLRESVHRGDVQIHADRRIAALAERQHGVVARRQLLDAGVTRSMIQRRLESQHLVTLHRGVYAIGHRQLRREARWLAAVLAAGRGAVLSHREAAALHGLRPAARTTVDVSVPAQRQVPGVQTYRVAELAADDVTEVDAIPVTTVARTLVDLAAVVQPHALRRAIEEAERSHRFDLPAVEAAIQRTRGRHGGGHAALRRLLADLAITSAVVTRSVLEDRFLTLLDAHGLPRPSANMSIDGIEVDAVWRERRLVVELDGWAYHRTREAFQRDRTRGNELQTKGWSVLRFTYADVCDRPDEVVARVRHVLAQAATGGRSAAAA